MPDHAPKHPPKTPPDTVCVSCHKNIDPLAEGYLVEKKVNPMLHRLEPTGRYLHEKRDQKAHQAGIWNLPDEPKPSAT